MADEQTVDTQNPDANQAPEASGEDLAAVYKCSKSNWQALRIRLCV